MKKAMVFFLVSMVIGFASAALAQPAQQGMRQDQMQRPQQGMGQDQMQRPPMGGQMMQGQAMGGAVQGGMGMQQGMDMQQGMGMQHGMGMMGGGSSSIVASDGGVIVLSGHTLYKYDKNLMLVKEVQLPKPEMMEKTSGGAEKKGGCGCSSGSCGGQAAQGSNPASGMSVNK